MASRRDIKMILKAVIVVSWLMMFFSVNKYNLDLITIEKLLHSFLAHVLFMIINGVLILCIGSKKG